jgi:hypothetical protein
MRWRGEGMFVETMRMREGFLMVASVFPSQYYLKSCSKIKKDFEFMKISESFLGFTKQKNLTSYVNFSHAT